MNNVRDAPRQPRDFSEGAGKGPCCWEHLPKGALQEQRRYPKTGPWHLPTPRGFLCPSLRNQPLPPGSTETDGARGSVKPNGSTKREVTILQSPRQQRERHKGGTQHQTKFHSPAGKRRGAQSCRGTPHAMPGGRYGQGATRAHTQLAGGVACATRVAVAVPAACLHTHVPGSRVTTSNVNARPGFLQLIKV